MAKPESSQPPSATEWRLAAILGFQLFAEHSRREAISSHSAAGRNSVLRFRALAAGRRLRRRGLLFRPGSSSPSHCEPVPILELGKAPHRRRQYSGANPHGSSRIREAVARLRSFKALHSCPDSVKPSIDCIEPRPPTLAKPPLRFWEDLKLTAVRRLDQHGGMCTGDDDFVRFQTTACLKRT